MVFDELMKECFVMKKCFIIGIDDDLIYILLEVGKLFDLMNLKIY